LTLATILCSSGRTRQPLLILFPNVGALLMLINTPDSIVRAVFLDLVLANRLGHGHGRAKGGAGAALHKLKG